MEKEKILFAIIGLLAIFMASYLEFSRETHVLRTVCGKELQFGAWETMVVNLSSTGRCEEVVHVNSFRSPWIAGMQWMCMFVVAFCVLEVLGWIRK